MLIRVTSRDLATRTVVQNVVSNLSGTPVRDGWEIYVDESGAADIIEFFENEGLHVEYDEDEVKSEPDAGNQKMSMSKMDRLPKTTFKHDRGAMRMPKVTFKSRESINKPRKRKYGADDDA